MSKNMTRKSLAIGAVSALVIAGFSALPANAAGLADKSFVSLAPTTGVGFTVVSGNGKTVSITSNEATSASGTGRNLKFLVTDPDSAIEPTVASTRRVLPTFVTSDKVAFDHATNTVTLEDESAASIDLVVGDVVSFSAAFETTTGTVQMNDANVPYTVTAVATNTFSFVSANTEAVALSSNVTLEVITVGGVISVLREARATDGSYVVDTGVASDSTDEVLVLAQGNETTTRSVTVTAWVDANGNDAIDSTEYTSPTETVTFKKASEIVGTATWSVPALGDANLVATFTTAPVLNGVQVGNSLLTGKFTRQGTALVGYDLAAWNATNGNWDLSLDANGGGGTVSGNTSGNWSSPDLGAVTAGTYSVNTTIGTTVIGTAVAVVVGSTQADDVKSTIAGTANVNAAANETASSATGVAARSGSTVTVTATVYDNASTPAVVGAGIPVTATLTSVTGTIKVNASASSDQELTDANGQVTFTVTTTTAVASQASDAATLTIQAQNVTGAKAAAYTLTWDDATATVFDTTVANDKDDRNRSVAKNGTVNFGFFIADQWSQSLSGSYRLLVENSGNTVSTYYAAVSGGSASVSVTDGQIGAGSSISTGVTVQKDVDGVWTTQAVTNTASGNKITYTIGVLTQTDTVTLDTDNTSTYGSATADDSDAIAAKATVAMDTRTSNATVPVYTNDVVVTGNVANSLTAAARAGALVTISGASDLLFSSNGVYAFGSLTLATDSSGEFDVSVYSNKAQANTVVTVTSNGASATRKISFTAVAATAGTSLVITAPASAMPGSTFQVVATLTDDYGNPVAVSTTTDVSVTYTGPGIVFGALPNTFDVNGQLKFAVLLGTNDQGIGSISVSYDQASDNDFTGTAAGDLDLVVTKTLTVGAVASATKVNVGSFKGYVALYAKGYKGKKMSAIVAGKWIVVASLATDFERVVRYTGAGYDIVTTIYIDGVSVQSFNVTTK